jgi:surfactin synthase thioesterase subunit
MTWASVQTSWCSQLAMCWLEMHVFDGAHLLLETHYRECADAIQRFIENNPREGASIG